MSDKYSKETNDDPLAALLTLPIPTDMEPTAAHTRAVKSLLNDKVRASKSQRVATWRWRAEWLSVAALVIAVVGILFWPASSALRSQVEVTAKTLAPDWIHESITDVDGSQLECWTSPSVGVQVYVFGNGFRIDDAARGMQFTKRPGSSTIYRVGLGNAGTKWAKESQQMKGELLSSPESEVPNDDQTELVADDSYDVMIDGRKLIERIIVTKQGSQTKMGEDNVYHSIYRYDLETGRAVSSESRNATTGEVWAKIRYDYPIAGPSTLAELGVPEDAGIVDGFPPPPDNLFKSRNMRDFLDRLSRAFRRMTE